MAAAEWPDAKSALIAVIAMIRIRIVIKKLITFSFFCWFMLTLSMPHLNHFGDAAGLFYSASERFDIGKSGQVTM